MNSLQRSLVAVSVTAAAIVGCARPSRDARRIAQTRWDTVWRASSGIVDSLIPSPGPLAFSNGLLLVVDQATPRVVALDPATGALKWGLGRAGSGPTEFRAISSMFRNRDGGVGVIDPRARRATLIAAPGTTTALSTAKLGGQADQMCPFGPSRYLAADVLRGMVVVADSSGNVTDTLPFPWPDLGKARWEARQVTLGDDGAGRRCLVALSTGRGFAVVSPHQRAVLGRYIEPFEVYGAGERREEDPIGYWATYDAKIVSDTIWVLFAGRSKRRYRILDRYDALTGAYLDTYELPFPTRHFAIGGGTIFVIDSSRTGILALRVHR